MPTDKQETIRAALQLEKDGRQFYLDAAGRAGSDLARQTFEALGEDEVRHMQYIHEISAGEETLATVNQRTYARLRGIFADVPDSVREAASASAGDTEALNFAIAIEEKSRVAYAAWSEEAEGEEVRALCTLLVGAEAFHRELLENVIEYLDSPSDYFLRTERWIVEG